MISQAAFAQLMQQIALPAATEEYDRFARYCAELQEWNCRMNLTAITDDEGVAEKHFADSLLPLTMAELPQGAALVDVGSGAGFPGLPMALVRPDLQVTFLDSLQKRLTFLQQLTEKLQVRCCHRPCRRQPQYAGGVLPAAGSGRRAVPCP